MQFSICIPELCLIRFLVKDSDKSNTDLGQYSIPFLSMQSGIERNVSFSTMSEFFFDRISSYSITG